MPAFASAATWRIQPGDEPRPPAVTGGRTWDAVTVSEGVGRAALDVMLAEGRRVGPVVLCVCHRSVYIPVASRSAQALTARFDVRSADLSCPSPPHRYAGCSGRLWLLPARVEDDARLTDWREVFHAIHMIRARGRLLPSVPPQGSTHAWPSRLSVRAVVGFDGPVLS